MSHESVNFKKQLNLFTLFLKTLEFFNIKANSPMKHRPTVGCDTNIINGFERIF